MMSAQSTTRWMGIGLLGLPLYGALTFYSSIDPQPDPNVHLEAWSRFVTTDHYVWGHLLGSILGLIFAIFGTFALGAYLATSRAGRMGLVAMVITVLGSALFLPVMGTSTFSAPKEGQIILAGIEEYNELPLILADTVSGTISLLVVVLQFVGNVLLGVGVWRSGTLPKWAGALWAAAPVFMYPLGLVYAMTIGADSTPPTVPLGALLLAIGGAWMAWSALRRPSAQKVGIRAQPSAQ